MQIQHEDFYKKPAEAAIADVPREGLDPYGPNLLILSPRIGGETTYFNNWMHMTHVAYWNTNSGDAGITGEKVSDYMTEILKRLRLSGWAGFLEDGGPFNGYRVETWNHERAVNTPNTIDWGIEGYAGLTGGKITKIDSNSSKDGGVYSHEFGHNIHQVCGMDGSKNFLISQILRANYKRLRELDFTERTPEFERFAEDFKYFFGTNDVALIDNPKDDANNPLDPKVGRQVRWAREVSGLKSFIQGVWPVFNWLKDKDFSQFEYFINDGCFKWARKTSWVTSQWEAFLNGAFYRWDGQKWVVYT